MEAYTQRFSNPSFALAVEINKLAMKSLQFERQAMLYRINEQAKALEAMRSDYRQSGTTMDEVGLEMEIMQKSPDYQDYLRQAEEYNTSLLQLETEIFQVRKTFV